MCKGTDFGDCVQDATADTLTFHATLDGMLGDTLPVQLGDC